MLNKAPAVLVMVLLSLVAACAPAAPTPTRTPEPNPTPVEALATKPEHLAGIWRLGGGRRPYLTNLWRPKLSLGCGRNGLVG
jgi:hypothetical protein